MPKTEKSIITTENLARVSFIGAGELVFIITKLYENNINLLEIVEWFQNLSKKEQTILEIEAAGFGIIGFAIMQIILIQLSKAKKTNL
jgi:hypothetical protein